MMRADPRALVTRADLVYQGPVKYPIEGQPIGNGRMGALVWTSPHVWSLRGNARAFRFYERQGFHTDGAAKSVTHRSGAVLDAVR